MCVCVGVSGKPLMTDADRGHLRRARRRTVRFRINRPMCVFIAVCPPEPTLGGPNSRI